ncbi:MAG: acyltransferase family protein [Pseudomonadota bacterium]
MKYRREIDGLRALALLPVILFHAGFQAFGGGYVGVDVFFVISGYLITSIILAEKAAGTFSLRSFYERRARRILPALFLVMLVCLPFAWLWLLPSDMKEFSASLVAVSTFSSNVLFWWESGYFDTAAELKPLLHTWSLAVEEQYYLIFPLLLVLAWKLNRTRMMWLLVAVALVSLGLAQKGAYASPAATFYMLHTRIWELLVGALLAFYMARETTGAGKLNPQLGSFVSLAGLVMIAWAVLFYGKGTPYPSLFTLLPVLGAGLVILLASPDNVAGRVLGSRLLVGTGLLSYSAYLWHQPIFAFARRRALDEPGALAFLAMGGLTFGLAYLSWRYVEQPFRKKSGIASAQALTTGLVCVLFFWAFAAGSHWDKGFASRYSQADKAVIVEKKLLDAYVWKRMEELQLRDFTPSGKPKILVIGDSFSGDLVNALSESGLDKNLSLSTFTMSAVCGNLYVDPALIALRRPETKKDCVGERRYDNPILKERIKQADYVWLASRWDKWVAEMLPQSIDALEKEFGSKFVIFGPKNFGRLNLLNLVGMSPAEREAYTNTFSADHVAVNRLMKSTLEPSGFVDVSDLLCNSATACHLFTPAGSLIPFDNGHLTRDGAAFFGQRLGTYLKNGPLNHLAGGA